MNKNSNNKLDDFNVGDVVEHVLNGDWLLVIEVGKEQLRCRSKSLTEAWIYPWELKAVNDNGNRHYDDDNRSGFYSSKKR